MRNLLTLLAVLVLSTTYLTGQAQNKLSNIKGRVEDNRKMPLVSASVSLLKSVDSAVVKLTASSKEGEFQFENIPEGKYMLLISAIGYATTYSPVININGTDLQVEPILMVQQSKDLKAVTVAAKKPLIEQKLDRTVVNVDAAITNVGATAMEVLEKSPGVTVDKDGNISLKGKSGVQIFIDGRPSYMSGSDLANYLRNLNANQIDQLEIMTNPPAKFDAAGNSGIINIKTKKSKLMGYSGNISLSYGQGVYHKLNQSANFNYRKNKVNLFANLGFNDRENFNDLDIQRKFIDASTKQLVSHFDQESRIRDGGSSYNGKIGLDYFANKKSTFGFVFGGFTNPGKFSNTSDVFIADKSKIMQSITRASAANERTWKNFSTNLNFRHVFDTTGREFSMDADLLGYRSKNDQILVNSYFNPSWQPTSKSDTLLGNLPQDINIYSFKMDYLHPLKGNAKLEAGVKTAFINTNNNAVYDSVMNAQKVRDISRSNHFKYNENINAAYLNYSRPFSKKLTGQFGLRLEHTHSKGRQLTTGEDFERNYVQLFPTAFLQYEANKSNTFGINYGRRIQRPDYESLNPFIMFLDKYTFERGNPNLRPQFAHNVELSHTFKGFLTTTLNYTKTTDIITEVLIQNPSSNETGVSPENIASQRQYGVSVSMGMPVAKWWSTNVYVNLYNNLYKGIVNNDYVELGNTTAVFNLSNQLKLGKTTNAEFGGFYRTAGVDGVFEIGGLGAVNLGVSQQVLKGKGSVRLTVRDLFYTQRIDGKSQYSNIDAAFQQVRDSRVVTLNFTYRFSKGKAGSQKRRTGGAGDEQNRVKVDGGN